MKRQILVLTEAAGSGLGRFATELATALSQAGIEVTFISPPQPYDSAADHQVALLSDIDKPGLKYLNLIIRALAGGRHVLRIAGPQRALLMVQISPTFPAAAAPIIAAKLARACCILNVHDFYQQTLRFPRSLHKLERFLYRVTYRLCDIFVTTNEALRERLIQEAGIAADRILVLPHAVFVYDGVRVPSPDAATHTLLVLGSLRPNKRILQSIEAIAVLRARGVKVRLRIAGRPPRMHRGYWAECRALLATLDPTGFEVEDRYIDEIEIPNVLSGVDAVLCPYEDFDSQSGVAITALSNGLPLIATPAGALTNIPLMAGAWTKIDPPVKIEAIAAAIECFLTTPRVQRQMQARLVQTRILAELSWSATAVKLMEELTRLGVWPV